MDIHIEFAATMLFAFLAGFVVYRIALSTYLVHAGLRQRQLGFLSSARFLDFIFLGLAATFFVVHATFDLRKFESYNIWGIDFALFDQVIWNSLHGRLFENTIYPDAPILLGQRFSPILLVLTPLYAFHDPRFLVVLPAFATTLAAYPLYVYACGQVGRPLSLVVTMAYFLSPGVEFLSLSQFYEIMLAMPLLMLATLFLLRRQYLPFLVCLALTFLCKEEVGLIAAGIGLYIFFVHRKRLLGLGVTLAGLAWVLILVQIVIPSFQGATTYYYFGGSELYGHDRYEYLGKSLVQILQTIISRPSLVLQHLLVTEKIETVLQLFMPIAFLSLVGAEVNALALPTLGYTLLNDVRFDYWIRSHYYSPVYPFFFLGAVVGIRRIVHWGNERSASRSNAVLKQTTARKAALGTLVLCACLPNYFLHAPGPLTRNFSSAPYTLTAHTALGADLTKMIPNDAAVLAQHELAPHLSERRHIFIMTAIPCFGIADYLFADTTRPWYSYREAAWNDAFAQAFFETVIAQDGYILKKNNPMAQLPNPLNIRAGDGSALLGYSLPLTETVYGGQALHVQFVWRVEPKSFKPYVVQIHLVDAQGHLWSQQDQEPCRASSMERPEHAHLINDDFVLRLPPTMPPGNYRMTMAFFDKANEQYLEMRDASGRALGTELEVTSLWVGKNKGSFTASQLLIEQPLYIDMQEMRFLGYIPPRQSISPGEFLSVGVYWRARGKPRGDYIVAVQLRDASGHVAFEHASRPANGTYPTTLWDAGEVLLDWHDFDLSKDMASGDYQIFVVLRDEESNRVLGETKVSAISVTR